MLGRLTVGLLLGTCLSPAIASAQSWVGATSDFNTAANWGPPTVPGTGETATFSTLGVTGITFSADVGVGAFQFNGGALSHTFTLDARALTFDGAGITNSSSVPQTIASINGGALTFTGASTSGSARLTASGGTTATVFQDTSNAGSSTIGVSAGSVLQFLDSSTAGTATVTVDNADVTFFGSSSALNAIIVAVNGLGVSFANASTAERATVSVNSGAFLTFFDNATGGFATLTADNGGVVEFQQSSSADGATVTANGGGTVRFFEASSGGTARFIANAGGTVDFSNLTSAGTTAGSIEGGGSFRLGNRRLTVGASNLSTTVSGVISGNGGALVKVGTGTLTLTGANTYSGGTTISAGTLQIGNGGTTGSIVGNVINNSVLAFNRSNALTFGGTISGGGVVQQIGAGTLTLTGNNLYSGGTTINGGAISVSANANLGAAAGGLTLAGGTLQTTASFTTSRATTLNAGGGTFNTATGTTLTHSGAITGAGALVKTGTGTLVLGGNNLYSGGTLVAAGVLQGTTTSLQGNIVNNSQVTIQQSSTGTYAGTMSGTGSLLVNGSGTVILTGINSYSGGTTVAATGVLQGNSSSLQGNIVNNGAVMFSQAGSGTYAGNMSGTGTLTLLGGGTYTFTGTSTLSGPTTVSASKIVVNGSLTSTVTLDSASTIGGSGTVGGLVSNGGTLTPGNSIGTINVSGNFVQSGGVYQVEVNNAGQSDKVNVGGTATISNSSISVVAQSGGYARNTTYTILTANGGVSGTYSSVTSNFAFLTPSLSYDANNVYLSLLMNQSAFAAGAQTSNQYAVGTALDQNWASATGDFVTVLNALSVLSTQQGPQALNQISGQPYADFGTVNIQGSTLFMNAVGQQLSAARGGAPGSGQRQALAQACGANACDAATGPWGVWVSGLGGFGNVLGNGNSQTLTYNLIGTAAGIDYRVTPNVLLGVAAGYTNGQQWVDSFFGKGWSNTLNVTAYGSFTLDGFYADALAGYAYSNNQMQRQLFIPGLQGRTANGSTGANQFLGQLETGYRIGVFAPAATTVTPFARLQLMSINQAAFQEWGANSLSLNVAQQATNSVRSTLGADFGSAFALGNQRTLDMAVRVGWLHEYADTSRPMTAAFAGAPATGFTVYGATPQRDSAVIGLQANTLVADGAKLFFRYDGELGGGSDNHAVTAGVRLTW